MGLYDSISIFLPTTFLLLALLPGVMLEDVRTYARFEASDHQRKLMLLRRPVLSVTIQFDHALPGQSSCFLLIALLAQALNVGGKTNEADTSVKPPAH